MQPSGRSAVLASRPWRCRRIDSIRIASGADGSEAINPCQCVQRHTPAVHPPAVWFGSETRPLGALISTRSADRIESDRIGRLQSRRRARASEWARLGHRPQTQTRREAVSFWMQLHTQPQLDPTGAVRRNGSWLGQKGSQSLSVSRPQLQSASINAPLSPFDAVFRSTPAGSVNFDGEGRCNPISAVQSPSRRASAAVSR